MGNSIILFSNDNEIRNVFDPGVLKNKIFPRKTSLLSLENWILIFDVKSGTFIQLPNNTDGSSGIYAIFDGLVENNLNNTKFELLRKISNSSNLVLLVFHTRPTEDVKRKISDKIGSKAIKLEATHEIGYNDFSMLNAENKFFYFKIYNALYNLYHNDSMTDCFFNGQAISAPDGIVRITFEEIDKENDLDIRLRLLHLCLTPQGVNKVLINKLYEEIGLKEKLFVELEKISDPFSDEYIAKLTEIRDKVLLDNLK